MTWQSLLLDEAPLLVRRTLAQRVGLNEAIALQQLHFVLTHIDSRAVEIDGVRWAKAPLSYWAEQFPFWSEATIKRTFQSLKQSGLIHSERGREANVYTVDYAAVGQLDPSPSSICADDTAQSDPSLPIGEVEERLETPLPSGDGGAAAGTLFGPPPAATAPAPPASDADKLVEALHDHYVAVFGDRLRVKALTDARARSYRKALKATADDLELCKRAIDGLKAYRDAHPTGSSDVAPSVIFETGPHSGKTLTDQVSWWAEQADSGRAPLPAGVPTVLHARINERKLLVVQMHQQPNNGSLRERGEQAVHWLREHAHIEPVVEDGRVTGWKSVAQ